MIRIIFYRCTNFKTRSSLIRGRRTKTVTDPEAEKVSCTRSGTSPTLGTNHENLIDRGLGLRKFGGQRKCALTSLCRVEKLALMLHGLIGRYIKLILKDYDGAPIQYMDSCMCIGYYATVHIIISTQLLR